MDKPKVVSKIDKFPLYLGGICFLFILLCTVHFLRGRPLWLDELEVLRSVKFNGTTDFFTHQLQGGQVFPRVYLFFIQKIAQIFDLSVWSVRLLSFVSMLLAFSIWLRVGRLALKDNTQYLVFLFCWASSIPLIYYSAELKQYSMDVLVSGIFTWFLYRQENLVKELIHRKYTMLLMALPLLGFLSYPAFLFMLFPLYNLFMVPNKSREQLGQMGLYVMVLIFVLVTIYCIDLRTAKATADTQGFSDYILSFQSIPEFFKTLGEGIMNLFSRWFTEKPKFFKKIGIFFMFLGILYIPWVFFRQFKKNYRQISSVEILAFLLFLELAFLGAMKKYPFIVPRTSLFYCPITFLMTIKAMDFIKTYNERIYRVLITSFMVFLSVVSLGIIKVVMTKNLGSICFIW